MSHSARPLLAAAVLFGLTLVAATASADELSGQVTDAATGIAIEGAEVEVAQTGDTVTTDREGRFWLDLPAGTYELNIEATLDGASYRTRVVNQHVPQTRPTRAHLYTDHFLDEGHRPSADAVGLPSFSGRLPDDGPETLDLSGSDDDAGDPTHLSVPDDPPTTIRVGRREDSTGEQGCTDSSNPIVEIDEMELDEYVKGVLPPEIGVFQSLSGVSEVYKAFAIAAKSYGLYFMLYYDQDNRRDIGRNVPPHDYSWFHIDDTACNQRYSDDRIDITTEAAEAVEGTVLVSADDENELGKYEYAASCGAHGTRPAYQDAIVDDQPPGSACVDDWCGHDDCAGHEDHPEVSGSDRCLVRGVCQWGAASWGEAGQTYDWMLDHYQPNLQRRDIAGEQEADHVALSGYAYTDPDAISESGVPDAAIELSDGQSTTTNEEGAFHFEQVALAEETIEIDASKEGHESNSRSVELQEGVTNWGSIELPPVEDEDPSDDAGDTGGGDEADAGSPPPDADADDGGGDDASASQGGSQRSSEFGPLVSRSQGSDRGCASANTPTPPLAVLLALFGLGALRTRFGDE